jgi:hypothetical protein
VALAGTVALAVYVEAAQQLEHFAVHVDTRDTILGWDVWRLRKR